MRVEFLVSAVGERWRVSRGHTSPMYYPTLDRAVAAAENFARMAAARGDSAAVRVLGGATPDIRRFEPEATRILEVGVAWPRGQARDRLWV